MIHLHALTPEQIEREIVVLRRKIDAISPPSSMLESQQRHRLQMQLMQLQDEITRREHAPAPKRRRGKYSWRGNPPKSIAEKLNRDAEKRLKRALELETA